MACNLAYHPYTFLIKILHTILPTFQAPATHPYWRSPDTVNLGLKTI